MSRTRQQRFIPDEAMDARPVDFSPREESPSRESVYTTTPLKFFDKDAKPVTLESEEYAKSNTFSPANVG